MTRKAESCSFILCYKNFGKRANDLWRVVRAKAHTETDRLGAIMFIRLWCETRFNSDFGSQWRMMHRLTNELLRLSRHSRSSDRIRDALINAKLVLIRQVAASAPTPRSKVSSRLSISPKLAIASKQRLFSYSAEKIAEQLTFLEHQIFVHINPEEWDNEGWKDVKRAPHLGYLVARANEVTSWVTSTILCQKTTDQRSRTAYKFLHIAQLCRKLGNYNANFVILSAFDLWSISRTWKVILADARYRDFLVAMKQRISPKVNYKAYREAKAALIVDKLSPMCPTSAYTQRT